MVVKVDVVTLDKKPVDTVVLSEAVFGVDIRVDVLQRVVRWQMARRQAGTHQTKTVSNVSGTTRKPLSKKVPAELVRDRRELRSFVGRRFFRSCF